jgi:phosphoglycolate phosphatase
MTAAVLFDFDGTLADTSADLAAASCDALAAVGLRPPVPHTLYAYGSRGGRGMLRAGWRGPFDEDLFHRAFEVFLERYALRMHESTVLFDGVANCLEQLTQAGRRWGIVTNKGQRYTRPLVEQLGLRPEVLVCGDMVPQPKPSPDGLLQAAAALGLRASACVYVGDDGKDIAAAVAAGMPSIAALYGYSSRLGDLGLRGAHAGIESVSALSATLNALDARASCSTVKAFPS